jgi:hypothetical protein
MNTQEVAPARPYINRLRAVIHATQKLDTFIWRLNLPNPRQLKTSLFVQDCGSSTPMTFTLNFAALTTLLRLALMTTLSTCSSTVRGSTL